MRCSCASLSSPRPVLPLTRQYCSKSSLYIKRLSPAPDQSFLSPDNTAQNPPFTENVSLQPPTSPSSHQTILLKILPLHKTSLSSPRPVLPLTRQYCSKSSLYRKRLSPAPDQSFLSPDNTAQNPPFTEKKVTSMTMAAMTRWR